MLNSKFGEIKKSSINDRGVILSKSIPELLMHGIILIIITIVVISLDIFFVTHKVMSADFFNKTFPGLCVIFLILLGKHFLFDLFNQTYKIRFSLVDRKIEFLNLNSNVIAFQQFDENEIQITSNYNNHNILFLSTNNEITLNLILNANDNMSKDILSFITNNFRAKENQINTTVTYDCIHCGYKQFTDFEYCPKCGKNDEGNVLSKSK